LIIQFYRDGANPALGRREKEKEKEAGKKTSLLSVQRPYYYYEINPPPCKYDTGEIFLAQDRDFIWRVNLNYL